MKFLLSTSSLIAVPLLPFLVAAESSAADEPNIGVLPQSGTSTFLESVPHANASNTVTFAYDAQSDNPARNIWTWTVNVTDVAMPNASTSLDNARLTYTTFSFGWNGANTTLADAALYDVEVVGKNQTAPFLYLASYYSIPTNTSSLYNASQGSSCVDAIGRECISAILLSISSGKLGALGSTACAGIVVNANSTSFFNTAIPFGVRKNDSDSNTSVTASGGNILSNHTWAYEISEPYASGDKSIYNYEAGRLHIIALGSAGSTQILCNRAGAAVVSTATTTTTTKTGSLTASSSAAPAGTTTGAAGKVAQAQLVMPGLAAVVAVLL